MTKEFLERTLKYLLCQSWYLSGARSLESSEAFNWLMKEENQQFYLSGSDEGLPKLVKLAKYFLLDKEVSEYYVFPDFIVL
jgi:hypothetical protein